MDVPRPPPDVGVNQTLAPPGPMSELRKDVHPLGHRLRARIADVLELTVARTRQSPIDAVVQDGFDRAFANSTMALARLLAGEGPEAALASNRETWLLYRELAIHRAASLNDLITRSLHWRDAVADVLQQSAAQLEASPEALSQALSVLQHSLEMGLIRISKSFDSERERTEGELAFIATHDTLTGLPNRTLILDRTEQMLVRARRHNTPVAALFIGLDNFKNVNETLSHGAGNQLLRAVARRLDDIVRDTDALGRLGADEFVIIAEKLSLEEGPERIAKRVHEVLREPFTLTGEQEAQVIVTASIGIATVAGASADKFLRDADIAMYQAKWDGKNRHVSFEPGMQVAVQNRMELEMDLRDALCKEEFFLVYQPTFDLRDMSPTGMEALIRWRHPIREVVQPNDFIPLLEETGLIVEVGRWVLEEACRQGAAWREAGHLIGIAVNVSGRQLDDDEFVTDVRNALSQSGLDASALTLEITETALMRNLTETSRRLTAIRELGARIAIDDFGTGYSSLAHLQQFPIDALKIDRSFISRLTDNAEGEAFIHTLVQLGKALSIETLAEGIEQERELSMLQKELCDSGQGFLYARPLEVAAAGAFLKARAGGGAPAATHTPKRSGPHAVITHA